MNSSLLAENTSYFITVQVTKDERQAQYTQEVFIVPGDPMVVQIRYVNHDTIEELNFTCGFYLLCLQIKQINNHNKNKDNFPEGDPIYR